MIGRQHSCVSCPCSGDVTVKACPSTEVTLRTEDPEDPGLAQGLNLAVANERTSRLSQKPHAEMASEQGAADYVYTCKCTSSLARYSTWSQYVAAHPGRLLHIRIPRGQAPGDSANWYQYSVSDAEGVFDRRLSRLTKLQRCVAGLPQRNSLLLAGDFNCPISTNPPVCGSCVLTPNSTRYQDAKDLHNVLSTLHLCVLNTWQDGQLATFTFGEIASQIDFVIVRPRQADAIAKRAQIIADFSCWSLARRS